MSYSRMPLTNTSAFLDFRTSPSSPFLSLLLFYVFKREAYFKELFFQLSLQILSFNVGVLHHHSSNINHNIHQTLSNMIYKNKCRTSHKFFLKSGISEPISSLQRLLRDIYRTLSKNLEQTFCRRIFNSWNSLTIFARSSILDILQGSKYTDGNSTKF